MFEKINVNMGVKNMYYYIDEKNKKNMKDIIAVVKLVTLLFCGIVIYNHFFIANSMNINTKNGYLSIGVLGISTFISAIIYWIWSFFSIKTFKDENVKRIIMIENMFFIMVFSVLIILTNTYESQYKFLFLFIIITSTIQSGMKQGMTTAIISSAIILGIDLICAPYSEVNIFFQNDLIIAGVFVLTAWPLGFYVESENENLKQKNLQLKELSDELKHQNSHRKYIEDIILKNEACYSLLIENSREAIIVHRDNKILFANDSAVKLVGFENEKEMKGKSILDFTPGEEVKSIKSSFMQVYNDKKTLYNFEGKIFKVDKKNLVNVQYTSTYFIYEGNATILSIIHDITPEKQVVKLQMDVAQNIKLLNETREFNKLITELFSNISHELKTPLNVIYSAIQVLCLLSNTKKEDIEKKGKYLKVMKQNCYRLMRLINNFLDMTKADSGFLKLNMANLDIVNLVEDISLSVVPYVENKGLQLVFDTDVEEKIIGFDPDKIERIVLNLLSNAIKYTNAGGKIFVNIISTENNIRISVRDTGIGIPEDKLEDIFERFWQVDKTFKRACEGTGIGLSITKSFVEMHNGQIEVKSILEQGSEFIVTLPAKVLEEKNLEEDSIYETNIERINIEFSDIYSEV